MKKTILLFLFAAMVIAPAYLVAEILDGEDAKIYYEKAHTVLLPKEFPVYTGPWGVLNHGKSGGTRTYLPTSNDFSSYPGCYVACYSRNSNGAVYPVGSDIFVKGQVRVKGKYDKRVCQPDGYEYQDISAMQRFKDLCNREVRSCNDCWAGGDTGGWFGIQEDGTVNVVQCSAAVKSEMMKDLRPTPVINTEPTFSQTMSYGRAPKNAFKGGNEADGTPLYVAKARLFGFEYPAKLNRKHRQAYVSYNNREYGVRQYTVLTGNYQWQQFTGSPPANAVAFGNDRNNDKFYVIRAEVGGGMHLGRYDANAQKARIPYGGREKNPSQFEILVLR